MSEPDPLSTTDPSTLGNYTLLGRLGKGGQGIVYLGRDEHGEDYAIKVLNDQWSQDAELRKRFEKEVRAAQKVQAFCTAAIHEADLEGEPPFVVSEFVPGPSLQEAVVSEGPRRGASLQRLAISTATALVAIHQAGIVHRDFKPGNVLLGPDSPRVIDFGIARVVDGSATMTGSIMGTPSYMAPEQIEGGDVTDKVDVFAWGCVMAFASTGDAPFGADSVPAVVHRVVSAAPDLSGVPDSLRSIVESCLDKDPNRRPSASDLLMRLLGHDTGNSTPSADEAVAEGERASQRISRADLPSAPPPQSPSGGHLPHTGPGATMSGPQSPAPPPPMTGAHPPMPPHPRTGPQGPYAPYPPPHVTQQPMPPMPQQPTGWQPAMGRPPAQHMAPPGQAPQPPQPPQSHDPVLSQGWVLPAVFIAIIILLLLIVLIVFAS